jgi:hypothetical protein
MLRKYNCVMLREVIVQLKRFFGLLLFLFMLNAISFCQTPQLPTAPIPPLPGQRPAAEDEDRTRMERDMAKKANQERQANLKRDTEKLLQLSTELKKYVDKSNENVLSLEVMKKAEEIEKLAHSVKEKMKGQ